MVDIDAMHPVHGYVTPEDTPAISRRFVEVAERLWAEGIGFPGDAETAWVDSSSAARALARKMGIGQPSGYWPHDDCQRRLAGVDWGDEPDGRLLELYVQVCLDEGLDLYFC